ncbi:MAG: glycoside hydrolase family 3 N-terminal domain-containing protein [Oscillospiraceae bacterium]
MVDLRKNPFNLDDEGVAWVKSTISDMTLEEKIGQLFVNMGDSRDEDYLKSVVDKYHIGAVRYNPASAEEVYEQNRILQENSKIPLLIASNVESGGNGACKGGTQIGQPIKLASAGGEKWAYEMGRVSGIEASAIGSNWSFAPIMDIQYNWRNPMTGTRAFSSNPDQVLAMGKAYLKGITESNFVCAMKHFPGDGVDERDQHLCSSVNSLSCEEWDASYGKVYSGMIDAGVHAVMAGHIMQPAYQRLFHPGLEDKDLLPATLCKELITDLLRGKLGFNGLVVTDASHMVGMTGAMARRDILPTAIAAGCDLFLFFNDPDEDFGYMMDGYKNGVITPERLNDALEHILGTKAHLGLHKKAKKDIMPPKEGLSVIGCKEHLDIAKQVSDLGITLVKNVGKSPLPISPKKYKRILIVTAGQKPNPMLTAMLGGGSKSAEELLQDKLTSEGYEVEIFVSAMDRMAAAAAKGGDMMKNMMNMYAGKSSVEDFKGKYDLVIQVANVSFFGAPVQRLTFSMSKGGFEMPWYVHEVPVIFVSMNCPYHLADVPQVKTYINCFDAMDYTVDALVDKMSGRSEFKGVSPVDAFCGMVDAHI